MGILFPTRIDHVRGFVSKYDDAVEWDSQEARAEADRLVEVERVKLRPGRTLDDCDVFYLRGLSQSEAEALLLYAAEQHEIGRHIYSPYLISHGLVSIRTHGESITERTALTDIVLHRLHADGRNALSQMVYVLTFGGALEDRPFRDGCDSGQGRPHGSPIPPSLQPMPAPESV